MKLVSVNVSPIKRLSYRGKSVPTGIFKEPVARPVRLRALGLDGDHQADQENHGGVDQAVYLYPAEHYAYWSEVLGRTDLAYGQFGENLTVEGMTEAAVRVGQTFRIGSALIQISQSRVPCYKLGAKMGSQAFPKRFLDSRRLGFYARVLEEGEVAAGDTIRPNGMESGTLTVAELVDVMFFDQDNRGLIQKALRARGLSEGWRERLAARLSAPTTS
ncbi:MOSC domain-containing protein [Candidatus Nitrospira bockiana]